MVHRLENTSASFQLQALCAKPGRACSLRLSPIRFSFFSRIKTSHVPWLFHCWTPRVIFFFLKIFFYINFYPLPVILSLRVTCKKIFFQVFPWVFILVDMTPWAFLSSYCTVPDLSASPCDKSVHLWLFAGLAPLCTRFFCAVNPSTEPSTSDVSHQCSEEGKGNLTWSARH